MEIVFDGSTLHQSKMGSNTGVLFMAYEDSQQVEKFVADNYAEVRDLYYYVVWNWLPEEVQKEIDQE